MAYYTDYTTTVAYTSSVAITNSKASNALASLLVDHCGFTLTTSANESAGSNFSTNYAEVNYHGIPMRIAQTADTLGSLYTLVYYNGYAANINTTEAFGYTAGTNVVIKIRVFNTISGCLYWFFNASGSWARGWQGCELTGVNANDTATYALVASTYFVTNDSATIYCCDITSNKYYDPDGLSQVYSPKLLYKYNTDGTSSGTKIRYLVKDTYVSNTYIYSNIVQVGTKFFMVDSYGAVEIQSP